MSSERFLTCNQRLDWLKPMFRELKTVIHEYVESVEEPPYWNNENASVSMLVAAGARSGYIVLSDYRTEKTKEDEPVDGRCDFYIEYKSKPYPWLEIEAKPIYVRPNNARKRIAIALRSAVADADCLDSEEPDKRAGLVFATLSMAVPDGATQHKNFRWSKANVDASAFQKVFRAIDADLCWMWWDACADKKYRWENEERFHPGMAVFLNMCSTKRQREKLRVARSLKRA